MTLINEAMGPPAMTGTLERLIWDEICQRYPDEWIVMAEPSFTGRLIPPTHTAIAISERAGGSHDICN